MQFDFLLFTLWKVMLRWCVIKFQYQNFMSYSTHLIPTWNSELCECGIAIPWSLCELWLNANVRRVFPVPSLSFRNFYNPLFITASFSITYLISSIFTYHFLQHLFCYIFLKLSFMFFPPFHHVHFFLFHSIFTITRPLQNQYYITQTHAELCA